ncbi:MAG: acetolactate synthase small subunit, partial [Gammaproteobacteria bacterium]|nr:acetolactate synthase small subunit [Gammaproteobacteria bacterium]
LIDVVKVADISGGKHIERELMMVKVQAANPAQRDEFKRMADIFNGRILDTTDKTFVIELTGPGDKLDAFLANIDQSSILETVRSGATGIARGSKSLRV